MGARVYAMEAVVLQLSLFNEKAELDGHSINITRERDPSLTLPVTLMYLQC
jgi:hypothetical protein